MFELLVERMLKYGNDIPNEVISFALDVRHMTRNAYNNVSHSYSVRDFDTECGSQIDQAQAMLKARSEEEPPEGCVNERALELLQIRLSKVRSPCAGRVGDRTDF